MLEDKGDVEESSEDGKSHMSEAVDRLGEDGMTLTTTMTIKTSVYVEEAYTLSFNWSNLKAVSVKKTTFSADPANSDIKVPVVALTVEFRTPVEQKAKHKTVGELAGTSTSEDSETIAGFQVIFRKREDAEKAQSLLLSIVKQKKLKVASS